jgi:hypothetical protein
MWFPVPRWETCPLPGNDFPLNTPYSTLLRPLAVRIRVLDFTHPGTPPD